jgi:Fe-S protein assembly co-chaperone HscB
MVSAHINNAYNTLNSPLLKTIELLRQNGIVLDLNIDKQLPANFLTLQMELYEEIEDVNSNTEELEKIAHKLVDKANELDDKIAENFAINNFAAIVDDAKKLAFYNKLRSLVDQKIEESW